MGRPLHHLVLESPGTAVVSVVLVGIWLYMNQRCVSLNNVAWSYKAVVAEHQAWRMLSAQLAHVDVLHLVFNISSLWSVRSVEITPPLGMLYYARVTALLLISTAAVALGLYYLTVEVCGLERYREATSVGYSGVVFGWMALLASKQPWSATVRVFGVAPVPAVLLPFLMLVVTALLIPRASFIGHLAGILAGFTLGLGADVSLGNGGTALVVLATVAGVLAVSKQSGREGWRELDNMEAGQPELRGDMSR